MDSPGNIILDKHRILEKQTKKLPSPSKPMKRKVRLHALLLTNNTALGASWMLSHAIRAGG